jgi:hypothetical protein
MDVKTTFLNGEIEEEVYIEQPNDFLIHEKESHVCRLKKTMYGLKQTPRAWYARIDGYLMSLGFNKSVVDPNLYYKIFNGESLILVLYVDDLFLTGTESLIVFYYHLYCVSKQAQLFIALIDWWFIYFKCLLMANSQFWGFSFFCHKSVCSLAH